MAPPQVVAGETGSDQCMGAAPWAGSYTTSQSCALFLRVPLSRTTGFFAWLEELSRIVSALHRVFQNSHVLDGETEAERRKWECPMI